MAARLTRTTRSGRSGTHPTARRPARKTWRTVEPGYDVDTEGEGDILRITRKPQAGQRTITLDDDKSIPRKYRSIVDETMDSLSALLHGASSTATTRTRSRCAFDDGPDPSGRRRSSTS